MSQLPLAEIEAASRRIAGRVVHTPLVHSPTLSQRCGVPVYLKLENRQTTGSFKIRGALNAVSSLPAKTRALAAASSGNHGRALAHAAAAVGMRAIVCASRLVPAHKIEAIRALGAEVRIAGRSQDDAQEEVDRLVREEGLTSVSPFDDPFVIAGQGTVGLEILGDLPQVELVLVPLSGGGLASGVAAAIKAQRPSACIIGVSMERGAAMYASLKAGAPVEVEELETLADCLGGGIGLGNRHTFAMVKALLDDVVLLSEAEIGAAVRHAFVEEGEIVEGGGGVGIGALLAGKVAPHGPTVVVLSGGNVDPSLHRQLVGAVPAAPREQAS
ncbi:MAG: hydroxyectoine utilization dehydratase EutB [Methylobacteriaceae bacterium]|nr:hydroxyectoine utilization dehydratase EutB [Methylobacteriaceae bacterium]MBV9245514.1 hydroxyectoine utilization dehydratase EutB [Methylobacteriaceae bacterium]